MFQRKWMAVGVVGLLLSGTGMMSDGCQQNPSLAQLAGLWSLERGATSVRVSFTVNNGGEVQTDSSQNELQPLDAGDFPAELADLVTQWNAGLDDLNANLDKALPETVAVEFPNVGVMRISDPNDPAGVGNGLINNQTLAYSFLGDLSGAGGGSDQGGGAVLQASSVVGSFDADSLTTTGEIARTLLVALQNSTNNSGLSFTVQIVVNYTGQRTGDLPEPVDNTNDNTNDNQSNGNSNTANSNSI